MELLAPAGSREALLAAINNGADAVYLGGPSYSARPAAASFEPKQMEEAVAYAHLHGRKAYIAVNTLINDLEFEPVLEYLSGLLNLGADAIILQDMGLLQAARRLWPGLPLHASTQMNTHNQAGADFLHGLGVKRIVLARELATGDIAMIHAAVPGVELEVFVHGALCCSYSGQCLMSSMLGGRSGNRGQCAQPCRRRYRLHRDGQPAAAGDEGRYWLSPADLCLVEHLPALARAGATALKIEGRMRRPEYVAVVTRVYRQVLDRMHEEPAYIPPPDVKERLRRVFNRGFTAGFLGPDDQLMSLESPKNRGVLIGRVVEQDRSFLTRIRLDASVALGDGLAVGTGLRQTRGLSLREIRTGGASVDGAGAGQMIEIRLDGPVSPSALVFKTHDEGLLAEARPTMRRLPAPRIAVDAHVFLAPDQPLRLVLTTGERQVTAFTKDVLQPASRHPLTAAILKEKIARLGDSPFVLGTLTVTGEENGLTVPFSDINQTRRRAVDLLQAASLPGRANPPERAGYERDRTVSVKTGTAIPAGPARLAVTVGSPEMAVRAFDHGADLVYLVINGLGTHRRLDRRRLERLRAGWEGDPGRLVPVLPRISRPMGEFDYRAQVEGLFPAVMISNWADVTWARDKEFFIHTDYNMNVFNSHTLRMLAEQGAGSICLSPELTLRQLAGFGDLRRAELLVHGGLILMQSQYCLLGQTRAPGPPLCSRPCRSGDYILYDERGYGFPLQTDSDCRQYVFNSRTLCLMEILDRILALHPASIRIDAYRMEPGLMGTVIGLYREVLDLSAAGRSPDLGSYQRRLEQISRAAFTKGHYHRGVL